MSEVILYYFLSGFYQFILCKREYLHLNADAKFSKWPT